jgi:hypothetical protein
VAGDVIGNPAPEQRDRRARAPGRAHARAAQFEQFATRSAAGRHQRGKIEFAGAVEASGPVRDAFAQQAIGAHHAAFGQMGARLVGVDDQQVVAQGVIGVGVEGVQHVVRLRAHLGEEDIPAQGLDGGQIPVVTRQPHCQAAVFPWHRACVCHACVASVRTALAHHDDTGFAQR